jgi:hypothetical protein
MLVGPGGRDALPVLQPIEIELGRCCAGEDCVNDRWRQEGEAQDAIDIGWIAAFEGSET